jgi:hypothetical protein
VATAGEAGGQRRFVIRVVGEGQRGAAARVREAGIEVIDG